MITPEWLAQNNLATCDECGGEGSIDVCHARTYGGDYCTHKEMCEKCGGSGYMEKPEADPDSQ